MQDEPGDFESIYLRDGLDTVDADTDHIIQSERQRQAQRLILIPSESIAPPAVLQALGSEFNNVYAEGYPRRKMAGDEIGRLLDQELQMARHRRYSDNRFYQGTEYADIIECLARRRCAEAFATDTIPAERIFVNVQPLSGTMANNAVYAAFVEPGDTIMGMALSEGGHLTHGSEFNRSGKQFRAVSYHVDPSTGRLDYDAIMKQALEHQPRMIIAGYTAYPWAPDWQAFREITDAVDDCVLLADIAHPAGMVIAGEYPSPLGYADVITFTTHKTLCGPRGAAIMTTDSTMARRIDEAVFPGEQGGPHVNKFAAMAVAFNIARTETFRHLQKQIVANCRVLAEGLARRDIPVAYGGTNTHLCLADLSGFEGEAGYPLKGEIAARILELCGIVVNKNMITGDETAADASAIRLGTPWITQRGLTEDHMDILADIIAETLQAIRPFSYEGATGRLPRGKIALDALQSLRLRTREIAELAADPRNAPDEVPLRMPGGQSHSPQHRELKKSLDTALSDHELFRCGNPGVLLVRGDRSYAFLQNLVADDLASMQPASSLHTFLLDAGAELIDDVLIVRGATASDPHYLIATHNWAHDRVKAWLQGNSDGYIVFDEKDIYRKIEGPVVIEDLSGTPGECKDVAQATGDQRLRREADLPCDSDDEHPTGTQLWDTGQIDSSDLTKPYFVGQRVIERGISVASEAETFTWDEEPETLRRTVLYDQHKERNARLTEFAGWEMPVWYTGVGDEHGAVRSAAGLFDIGHMGIYEVSGPFATDFLNCVTTNYARGMEVGECQYAYILDPEGLPMDDVMVYCRAPDRYMMVVNAVNTGKIGAWLQAVNSQEYVIDRQFPHRQIVAPVELTNLKTIDEKERRLTGMALQGPFSAKVLKILRDENLRSGPLSTLEKFSFIEDTIADVPVLISRTGYTGEEIGFELWVHPDDAPNLWNTLLEDPAGEKVQPAGLGARDSTRTEAGLPLYGHEIAGPQQILPGQAGYAPFVKLHKPFFIGRKAYMQQQETRDKRIVRFRIDSTQGRMIRPDDLVASRRGKYAGRVTSCALAGDHQIGMAYVDSALATEGTQLLVFPQRQAERALDCSDIEQIPDGAQMMLHEPATVLSRFPEENDGARR